MAKTYKTISLHGQLFQEGTKITPAITRASQEAKNFGLALIKSKTPKRTGLLKSNWQASLETNGVRWENPTPYGIFVEMGTRHMAARAMLSSSLPAIENTFKKALAREVGTKLAKRIIADVSTESPSYDQYTNEIRSRSDGFKGGNSRITRGK